MHKVSVARDFHKYPGGRYPKHGKGNGEDFREEHILPFLKDGQKVVVVFDHAAGFPASFLDEAFGGLVRAGIAFETLKELLTIEAEDRNDRVYVDEAWAYIEEEAERASGN